MIFEKELLEELQKENLYGYEVSTSLDEDTDIILENDNGVNGASLMLDKDVLKEFADEHGVDEVILIPSSLHECMLVPKGFSIALTEKSCLEMLHDANLEAVERRDLLSVK